MKAHEEARGQVQNAFFRLSAPFIYLLFLKRSLSLNLKLAHGCAQAFQPMNFRNPFVSDAHHLRVPGTFCHTRLLI